MASWEQVTVEGACSLMSWRDLRVTARVLLGERRMSVRGHSCKLGAAARQATLTAALLLLAMAVGGCEEPSGSYPLPPPSDPHYADAWIAREVLRRLEGDRQLGRFLIHVQAHETVVYLQGTVPSEELRRRAQQLAERSPYVYAVRNNIAVVTRPLPPD